MDRHVLLMGGMRHLHAPLVKQPGVRTTLLMDVAKVKPVDLTRHSRVLAVRDDLDEYVRVARAVQALDPFTHMIAFDDRVQELAAAIAEQLAISFYARSTIEAVSNKAAMRARLHEQGIDDRLVFACIESEEAIVAFGERAGYPFILKPGNGQGSAGIAKISCAGEIAAAYRRVLAESQHGPVVAEQFLDGPEFSVEAVSQGGRHSVLAITRKYKDPQTFVEIGHQLPAALPRELEQEIESYVGRVLTALGIDEGPTHTELIVTRHGPQIVETHTRLGGDFIPELVEDATGVRLIDLSIRSLLGESILGEVEEGLRRYDAQEQRMRAAIWFRTADTSGTLVDIAHTEPGPGVVRVEHLKAPGSAIRPTQNSFDRLAAVEAVAESPEAALALARQTADAIEITVKLHPKESAS